MALSQMTVQQIKERKENISFLKDRRKRFESLVRYKDDKHWECLRDILKESAQAADNTVKNIAEAPRSYDTEFFVKLEQAKEARDRINWVIKTMEEPQSIIDSINSKISNIQEEINNAKEEGILE